MSIGWQEELRQRLIERNSRESAYSAIIEQYRRLAQQTRMLKERNQSLLRAVGSVRNVPTGSNLSNNMNTGSEENSAIRNAYIQSLESQISSLRDEMAAVYKTQGQNAQRLLAMNETLREKEEVSRLSGDDLRKAREEAATLRKKVDQHNEMMAEKDERLQNMMDEIQALGLELDQTNERNASLKQDNAGLLSRWLDKMNDEADKMNNIFYEDMKSDKRKPPQPSNGSHHRNTSEDSETWSASQAGETNPTSTTNAGPHQVITLTRHNPSNTSESDWSVVDANDLI